MARAIPPRALTVSNTPRPTPALPRAAEAEPEAPPPGAPLWIRTAEAAAQLGMTIEALMARAKEGKLGFKEGGRWRFSPSDLKRYTETIENRYLRRFPRR